jgi:adenylosuccinate lyase
MIPRYSRPAMAEIWNEQDKLRRWLEIEVLACEGMARKKIIPAKDARTIRRRAKFNLRQVQKNEARTRHDVLAFLEEVASHVGPAGRWIHQGLTSSDILDTTLAWQLRDAADLLIEGVRKVKVAAARRAREHRGLMVIGRTHGIHAEPTSHGIRMALLHDEFRRAEERLKEARGEVAVGKISGAVGTYAHLDPSIEAYVCGKLGLKPGAATQVVPRDRHAAFALTLALVAASAERWATEFRHLQRTEVGEVEESFAKGQKGSSAMPHKRNPIIAERICGLARIVRGHALAALENVALWHERDISHSSAERVLFPDATILLDFILAELEGLVAGHQVFPQRMLANLRSSRGLWASQGALLALTRAGLERRQAYEAVQRHAMDAWQRGGADFPTRLQLDPELSRKIGGQGLRAAVDAKRHLRHEALIYRRCGL